MILMKSAPPWRISRTRCRISSAEFATPARMVRGSTMSDAIPATSPPPALTVTYAPATDMRGPITVAIGDRIAQRDVDKRAKRPHIADRW